MKRHFETELEGLKTSIIKMGSLAEEAVRLAIKALIDNNPELAQRVLDQEARINSLEIEIDNAIVDILALQQPVAVDLRLILAAQKINNDLERIGDHAVNIAESALILSQTPFNEPLLEIPQMVEIVQLMLRDAIDGFIHQDSQLALNVLKQDDIIDNMNRKMSAEVIELMKSDKRSIEGGLDLIRISRNLERIADLATNIAEEVIFITKAKVVKHGMDKEANH